MNRFGQRESIPGAASAAGLLKSKKVLAFHREQFLSLQSKD